MGNWQLEVAKLSLYVGFPVAMFYYYNQASYFEEWVIKMKRQMLPPESKESSALQLFIQEYKNEQEAKLLRQMQEETLDYIKVNPKNCKQLKKPKCEEKTRILKSLLNSFG